VEVTLEAGDTKEVAVEAIKKIEEVQSLGVETRTKLGFCAKDAAKQTIVQMTQTDWLGVSSVTNVTR
jgi:hypothetical protein